MGLHGNLPPSPAAAFDDASGKIIEKSDSIAGVFTVATRNGAPGGADDLLLLVMAGLASMADEGGWRQRGFLRLCFDRLPGGVEELSKGFRNHRAASAEQHKETISRNLCIDGCSHGACREGDPHVRTLSGSSLEYPLERDGTIVFASDFG
jgi:hypothetical protein